MNTWKPTPDQARQWEEQGYFIVRNVIPTQAAWEVRGVIRNHILSPESVAGGDQHDPMDPMGDSPAARAARFRKLGRFCVTAPVIWHTIFAGEPLARIVQHFLGDDLLLKFNSCFLKPARTGSATPWHQDNGLWKDGETEPFNFWMAIDPATRENGCMQFVPTSHRTPIIPHIQYEGGVHPEIPREVVKEGIEKMGVEQIELDPGDAVCWHSNLWHFSPPNTSDKSRIAVAGVYTTPEIVRNTKRFRNFEWIMKQGKICEAFPPQQHIVETVEPAAVY